MRHGPKGAFIHPVYTFLSFSHGIAFFCYFRWLTQSSWASADFFPGEGKIFQGGAKIYYLPIKCLKTYNFLSKKSKKHTILVSQGGGAMPPLALPCGRPCQSS